MLEHSECRQPQISSQAYTQDVPHDVQVDELLHICFGNALCSGSQPVVGEGYSVLQVQRGSFHMLGRLHKTMYAPMV